MVPSILTFETFEFLDNSFRNSKWILFINLIFLKVLSSSNNLRDVNAAEQATGFAEKVCPCRKVF